MVEKSIIMEHGVGPDEDEDRRDREGTKLPTGVVGSRVAFPTANHRLGHPHLS